MDLGALWEKPNHYRIGAGLVFGPKGPDYAINGMIVWG